MFEDKFFFVVFFSAIPSFRVSFSLFVGWFVCLFCTDEVRSSFLFFSFFRVSVNCFAGFSLVASVVIFFASLFFSHFSFVFCWQEVIPWVQKERNPHRGGAGSPRIFHLSSLR